MPPRPDAGGEGHRPPGQPGRRPDGPRRPDVPADLPAPRTGAGLEGALRDAVAALDAGLAVVQADGTVLFANEALARLAGRGAAADLVGRALGDAIPALAALLDGPLAAAALADGQPRTARVAAPPRAPDARTLDVRLSRAGEGLLALQLRDVTAVAALEQAHAVALAQADAAQEAKSVFLATMSHELRTPLTALTGYGELLDDEILGPLTAAQQEMVGRMCSVIHHLTDMIDEMLTFSSLEAGRERVHAGEVASGDVLAAAATSVEAAAAEKGLALTVSVPATAPRLVTDPDKVRQILVHLADNAVKFTHEGEVAFAVAAAGGEVRFTVRDTGIGMPPEAVARIFQPFVQLDAGLTRRYGGTGLGLYIAARLTGLLGGRLEVATEPGAGSTFTLALPAAG